MFRRPHSGPGDGYGSINFSQNLRSPNAPRRQATFGPPRPEVVRQMARRRSRSNTQRSTNRWHDVDCAGVMNSDLIKISEVAKRHNATPPLTTTRRTGIVMAILTLSQALDRANAGEPIAPVCQIQWIDAQGNPTPDSNPAIARVRCKAREQIIAGRVVRFDQSQWFNICAEHAAQMSNPGMEIGECETL